MPPHSFEAVQQVCAVRRSVAIANTFTSVAFVPGEAASRSRVSEGVGNRYIRPVASTKASHMAAIRRLV